MDVSTKTWSDVRKSFEASEFELQSKINDILDKIRKHSDNHGYVRSPLIDFEWQKENEEALQRNRNLIKDIEFMKAKLRSHYYFQPATQYFNQQLKNYESYVRNKTESHQNNGPTQP